MKAAQIAKRYESLSPAAQARCLGRLAHCVTIWARDTYIPQTEAIANPTRLRRMNELQHQITGQLNHVLHNTEGYADVDFIEIITQKAAGAECQEELLKEFDAAISSESISGRKPHRVAS